MRVHVTGASGSGTTTLGLAVARRLPAEHLDTDDYFWTRSDPPFQEQRPMPERLDRLNQDVDANAAWVLSGSLCGWGDPLIPRFDQVVFLRVPTAVRLARLRHREVQRFGREALAPGGTMYETHRDFLDWAARYDSGGNHMRSLARHTAWLASIECPVLRLDGEIGIAEAVSAVLEALQKSHPDRL